MFDIFIVIVGKCSFGIMLVMCSTLHVSKALLFIFSAWFKVTKHYSDTEHNLSITIFLI